MENKIITFENYFTNSQSEDISDKYVSSRSNWVKDFKEGNEPVTECTERHIVSRSNWLKENKTSNIIDKIPSDELPECEDIEKSKVGDFLSKKSFDMYDDGAVWDELEDNSIMCYNSVSGKQTWWKIRKDTKSNNSKDGMVRIK